MEIYGRRASPAARGWRLLGYGIARVLHRLGVAPSTVTTAGLVCSVLVPVVAVRGGSWPVFAAVLVLATAVADTVDGAVAVIGSRSTRTSVVYDAVAGRVAEACWVAAFWALGVPGPLAVVVGGLCWLHEYIRARSGVASYTVGERPTRVSIAVVGLLLAGAAGSWGWGAGSDEARSLYQDLAAGTVTVVAAGWLLLGVFGISQLVGVVRTMCESPSTGR